MTTTCAYTSPIGTITLESDGEALTGLWIDGQRTDIPKDENQRKAENIKDDPILMQSCNWLDIYFTGKNPTFTPPVKLNGTPFQLAVWSILQGIPYGTTITYGDIAKEIAKQTGKAKMSAQAVGGAVGRNPISIIIPCHRVMGANGRLTGYQGGIPLKTALLKLEGLDTAQYR